MSAVRCDACSERLGDGEGVLCTDCGQPLCDACAADGTHDAACKPFEDDPCEDEP